MLLEKQQFYDFANFRVDVGEKSLRQDGKIVSITPKVFETLCVLVENAGRLVEKDELMRKIWQDRFVEEGNLTFNIKMLRKALGDSASNPQFIETVPKRGYRFIEKIEKIEKSVESGAPFDQKEADKVSSFEKSNSFPRFLRYVAAFALIGVLLVFVFGSMYRGNFTDDAPILSAPFASEKLSTNGKVRIAAISPDGKQVAYTSENGTRESIWLRELDTGGNVEIIPPSEDFYFSLKFSPNGNFIYFVRHPRGDASQTHLYRVSIFGGIPQKIVSDARSMSISPDGARISFTRCSQTDDEFCSLWIADAPDGKNERKLTTRPRPFRISGNDFSPDGKSIAFAVGQSENQSNEFGLSIVDIESATERAITNEKFFNIKSLKWLDGDEGLLIVASRTPNRHFRFWQISAANGAATPLTKDSEDYSVMSLDKQAKLLTAVEVKADFNLILRDRTNSTDKKVLTDATAAAFAPNGTLFFASSMSGNEEIWRMNADGSAQRQLTNDTSDDGDPIVSPDGSTVFFCSNRSGAAQVWRMNADGSNQIQITEKEGGFPIFVSTDGRYVYYQHGLERTLWRAAATGGNEEIVYDKRKYRFAFSPDGTHIAFSEKREKARILTVVSLADGKIVKQFPTPIENALITEIKWTADAKAIVFVLADNLFENNTLWQQPLDAGKPFKIADLGDDETNSLTLAPDDISFALIQGRWKHDAVLLKGLR